MQIQEPYPKTISQNWDFGVTYVKIKESSYHLINVIFMILDPKNVGIETLFVIIQPIKQIVSSALNAISGVFRVQLNSVNDGACRKCSANKFQSWEPAYEKNAHWPYFVML